MAIRRELTAAVGQRYREASRAEKARILDQFVLGTGLHRKHAMRLLRGEMRQSSVRRTGRRIYEEAERNALVVLCEASDRICGKRLKALLPLLIESMERNGHMGLAPEIRAKLLAGSASTIDRALGKIREEGGRQRRRPVASAERRNPGTDVRRLEVSGAGLSRSRSGRSQWALGARRFYTDAGAHGCCDLLDGVCAVAGARANAPEHRGDKSSPTAAALAARHVSR